MENVTLSIDTSSLKPKDISPEEFSGDMLDNIQAILTREFPMEFEKQRIKKSTSGFNFACPYCHDSAVDQHKKRAHVLLSGKFAGRFKCFNCGKGESIPKFFSDFKQQLALNSLYYIKNHVISPESWYSNQNGSVLTSEVINKDEVTKYAIKRDYIKKVLNLYEIDKYSTPIAYNYLVGRCQFQFNKFLYSPKYNQILILNLVDDNNIIGFQVKSLGQGKSAKYLTRSLQQLREKILFDNTVIPEYINNLSMVFNIFNVNIYKPILVTEGPFDAFLLPNCIATAGANKNLGVELPFWYVYDSDKTGLEHALQALKKGYNVFMWKKLKNELGLPYRNKWDINDVIIWMRDNNRMEKINWGTYFTANPLDGLNL